MRHGLVLLAALVFLPVAAAASPLPQLAENVPGLVAPGGLNGVAPAFMPAPGSPPTARECATAWNLRAPHTTLHWLAEERPTAAFVGVGTSEVAPRGGGPYAEQTIGPSCGLTVYYGKGQLIRVNGVWKDGTVPAWEGHLGYVLAFKPENASVAADGTLHIR